LNTMTMNELHNLTIADMRSRLDAGDVTAVQLTDALLTRIASYDGSIGAYLHVDSDGAHQQARAADARIQAGERGGLLGIPLGIKDVLSTTGLPTTSGSKVLENYRPPYDATAVARLKSQGAVLLGKLNCDEFAMGSSTENSAYQLTRNPWNTDCVPGGSSGGSAAAVAAGLAAGTLGTDTGGSIRQPASLCGITGLKPTYGRVSRYGLIAFASSLDQIGPMAWTARDCAMMLNGIAGHDGYDATSAPTAVPDYVAGLGGSLKGLRVGIPRELFVDGMQTGTELAVRESIRVLQDLGAIIKEISLPNSPHALPVYYIVATAEASSNLARFDGVRYGPRSDGDSYRDALDQTRGDLFGPEVRRRIMLGTYVLSAGYYDAFYKRAQQVRTLIRQDFTHAFADVDVIASPTSPNVAFKFGENSADPVAMYLQDVCTLPVSLAGLPGISVPCGFDNGLPIGLQLIGQAFAESEILRVADAYQGATNWHTRRP
jgi:aspartyl-tRNA(Asn)/glutamyl-tRNA(Gln) amidotransferase subunit A